MSNKLHETIKPVIKSDIYETIKPVIKSDMAGHIDFTVKEKAKEDEFDVFLFIFIAGKASRGIGTVGQHIVKLS